MATIKHFKLTTAVAILNALRVVRLDSELSVGLLRGVSFYLSSVSAAPAPTTLTFYFHARDAVNNVHGAAPVKTYAKATHALAVALDIDTTDPTKAVAHVSDFADLYLVPHPDYTYIDEIHVVLDQGTANLRVSGVVEL